MSVQNNVLYGNRLYDQETYSDNQDPQSLSLSLSDSTTMSDAMADSINQVLVDVATLAETMTTSGIKALSDSASMADATMVSLNFARYDMISMSDSVAMSARKVLADALSAVDAVIEISAVKALSDTSTMAEQRLFSLRTALADSLSVLDARVAIHATKSITDFIILNEWISVVLDKAGIWSTTSAQAVNAAEETLYDVPEYAEAPYSTGPQVIWQKMTELGVSWAPIPLPDISLPLYSKPLYSMTLYGQTTNIIWKEDESTVAENFTNFDGQGNVP